MIKGVNKQIIEIKCPKNEQFEKILLFVNTEKCRISDRELNEKAKRFAKRFLDHGRAVPSRSASVHLPKGRLTACVCAAAAAGAAVCAVSLFV